MNNATQVIKPHQFLTYNSAYRSFDHKENSSIKVLMINKKVSAQSFVLSICFLKPKFLFHHLCLHAENYE